MTSIVESILALYQQDSQAVSRRHRPTASQGLASICERYAWYEANSPRASIINPGLRRRMQYGNIHEEHIRNELREVGIEIKGAGMRLALWGVKGRLDLLIKENGVWKLLEIKTMNPTDFAKFQSEGLVAFPRYYEQFMFYLEACRLLPFKEADTIDRGILLAENTFPLGELHAEELGLDEECVAQMEANVGRLQEIIPLPDPPSRPFPQHSKRCQHCWRRQECWEIKQESKETSALALENPQELVRLVTEYLRQSEAKGTAEEQLDVVTGKIRTILDENQATRIRVPIAQDLSFTITLSQVDVSEYVVAAHSFTRLQVR